MLLIKKKQLKVYLPDETINKLRTFIWNKYPSYNKGPLSIEVNEAILRHISLDNIRQQTTNPKQSHRIDLIQLREQITDFMVDEGYWPEGIRSTIVEKHLRQAIIAIKNLKNDPEDTRTPDKWIKRMLIAGIIKKYGVHAYMLCNAEEELKANQQASVLLPVEQSQQSI